MGRKYINTDQAPMPIGPYSQAVQVGHTLYVSGQIGLNPQTGELIQKAIEGETDQVMQNIHAILKAAGLTMEHVVKCTILLKDMSFFSRVNEVYGGYFIKNPPAREAYEVARLPKDAHVEISCIAEADGSWAPLRF
jgi:2-iminobutanoate/2-iminopropanoate deaminase